MGNAPHIKAWPRIAQLFCARILGHVDRNYSDGKIHYAYCLRCGYLFGNPWGGKGGIRPASELADELESVNRNRGYPAHDEWHFSIAEIEMIVAALRAQDGRVAELSDKLKWAKGRWAEQEERAKALEREKESLKRDLENERRSRLHDIRAQKEAK